MIVSYNLYLLVFVAAHNVNCASVVQLLAPTPIVSEKESKAVEDIQFPSQQTEKNSKPSHFCRSTDCYRSISPAGTLQFSCRGSIILISHLISVVFKYFLFSDFLFSPTLWIIKAPHVLLYLSFQCVFIKLQRLLLLLLLLLASLLNHTV